MQSQWKPDAKRIEKQNQVKEKMCKLFSFDVNFTELWSVDFYREKKNEDTKNDTGYID